MYKAVEVRDTGSLGNILEDGPKVLLGMKLGNKESYEDSLRVFQRFKEKRTKRSCAFGTTDGAPGLIRAFKGVFPQEFKAKVSGT